MKVDIVKFFPKNKIIKIKTKSQKPGLSVIRPGVKFFKYQVFFLKNAEIIEKELYLKKAKTKEYRTLKQLKGSKIVVPKPLFYFPKKEMLLYEGIKGEKIEKIIEKRKFNLKMLKEIAKSLNEIHQLKLRGIEKNSMSKMIKKVKGIFLAFARHLPTELEKVKKILNQILFRRKRFLKDFPKKFTHGDFTPANLTLTKEKKIGVIDFSNAILDDCLFDVSNFLSQLNACKMRYKIPEKQKTVWQNKFREYFLALSKEKRMTKERIDLYQAWNEIHNASIFIKGNKTNKEQAKEMIKEAQKMVFK